MDGGLNICKGCLARAMDYDAPWYSHKFYLIQAPAGEIHIRLKKKAAVLCASVGSQIAAKYCNSGAGIE